MAHETTKSAAEALMRHLDPHEQAEAGVTWEDRLAWHGGDESELLAALLVEGRTAQEEGDEEAARLVRALEDATREVAR